MLARRAGAAIAKKTPFIIAQDCILVPDSGENDDVAKIARLIELVRRDEQTHDVRNPFERTIIYVNSNKLNRQITCALGLKNIGVSLFTTDMLEEDNPRAFEEEKMNWKRGIGHIAVCTLEVAFRHKLAFVEHTIFFDFPENDYHFVQVHTANLKETNMIRRNSRMTTLFGQNASNKSKLIAYSLMKNHSQNAPDWLQTWLTNTFREVLGNASKTAHRTLLNNSGKPIQKSKQSYPLKENLPVKDMPNTSKPVNQALIKGQNVILDMDIEDWEEDEPLIDDPNWAPSDYTYTWESSNARPVELSDDECSV